MIIQSHIIISYSAWHIGLNMFGLSLNLMHINLFFFNSIIIYTSVLHVIDFVKPIPIPWTRFTNKGTYLSVTQVAASFIPIFHSSICSYSSDDVNSGRLMYILKPEIKVPGDAVLLNVLGQGPYTNSLFFL